MLNVASKPQVKALYNRFIKDGIKVYDVVKDGPEQYIIYGITKKKKLNVRLVIKESNVKWLDVYLHRGNENRIWSINIESLGVTNREYGYVYEDEDEACLKTYLKVLAKDSIDSYKNGDYLLKGNMVFFDMRTSLMILAISTLLISVVTLINLLLQI